MVWFQKNFAFCCRWFAGFQEVHWQKSNVSWDEMSLNSQEPNITNTLQCCHFHNTLYLEYPQVQGGQCLNTTSKLLARVAQISTPRQSRDLTQSLASLHPFRLLRNWRSSAQHRYTTSAKIWDNMVRLACGYAAIMRATVWWRYRLPKDEHNGMVFNQVSLKIMCMTGTKCHWTSTMTGRQFPGTPMDAVRIKVWRNFGIKAVSRNAFMLSRLAFRWYYTESMSHT